MLIAKPSNLINVGPFFSETSLTPVLQELAKIMVHAGSHMPKIEDRSLADFRLTLDYLKTQADWAERNFRKPMDRRPIADIEAMVNQMERLGKK